VRGKTLVHICRLLSLLVFLPTLAFGISRSDGFEDTDAVADRLLYINSISIFDSVLDLTAWISGATDKITSADDLDGTITLSIADAYLPNNVLGTLNRLTVTDNLDGTITLDVDESGIDHNLLSNLTVGDVHTQYFYLAGRSGGQVAYGGTASGDDLTLVSTIHATKGLINLGLAGNSAYDEVNDRLGIGTASPTSALHVIPKTTATLVEIIQGMAGQTANLTQWRDSASTVLSYVDKDGYSSFPRVFVKEELVLEASAITAITAGGGITPTDPTMRVQGDGGAVTVTVNPQIAAGNNDGAIMVLSGESDTNTVTLNNGSGLHLHGKAKLGVRDSMILSYNATAAEWTEISRNFPENTRTWPFVSPSGASGIKYYGGFYEFGSSDNDFNPSINFGTANAAKGAHFFIISAAGGSGGTDTVLTITGTSITDEATRTTSDTETITVDDAGSAGTYYETVKKWIGQIAIVVTSGPDILCNYGFCKYWDNNNNNLRVVGVDVNWIAGANDATPDIKLRHHKATGWTYNAGSTPTPPAAIASMATDYNTEIQLVNGEQGAWKRDNLNTSVAGGDSEGTIIEVTTTSNKAFEIGSFLLRTRPSFHVASAAAVSTTDQGLYKSYIPATGLGTMVY